MTLLMRDREKYAEGHAEGRTEAIRNMIELGASKEKNFALGYEEELYNAVEAEMFQMA